MYKNLVLILLCVSTLYSIVMNLIKHRSAKNPTPESVKDIYDSETYAKWIAYSAENCILELVSTIISFAIMIALLYTNAFSAFAKLFGDDMFARLAAVAILQIAIGFVVDTVVGYIKTMVIEQKYGFNRSSLKTFIFDSIRSLLLSAALTFALASLMTLFEFGDWPVFVFAATIFAFTLAISFLYPYISRIGNKFTPLEEGELKSRLLDMLGSHGYQVKSIEVMDASRRTTKMNAYIAGFGKTKTIVLYDTLVEKMSVDEICAIFAHEMGHGLHKDVIKSQLLNVVNVACMSLVVWGSVSMPQIYLDFGFDGVNYGFAYIVTGIGLGIIQPLISLIMNAHSRAAEYAADRQAVIEGYGEPMITAFKKMAVDNFVNLSPSKINVVLEYSHPPIHCRIDAIKAEINKSDNK
ncbi:MAG: M48 family metallopeptidase [Ruminococcaceae bacterium]|nr:M48 family metallopeptidase [Oscillospiraceae bacterium]